MSERENWVDAAVWWIETFGIVVVVAAAVAAACDWHIVGVNVRLQFDSILCSFRCLDSAVLLPSPPHACAS